MTDAETTPELAVKLDLGPQAGPEEVDELARSLRDELLQLDVHTVDLVNAGVAPEGTKGFGLLEVGALIVKFGSSGALRKVVDTIRRWAAHDANRSAKLVVGSESLEVTGISTVQQQQLIDEWVRVVSSNVGSG